MNSDGERGYIPPSRHTHSKTNNNISSDSNSISGNNSINNHHSNNSISNSYENNYDKTTTKLPLQQQQQQQQQQQYQQQQERYLWEMRKRSPNTTPASTVLNSPDLTDLNQYSQNSLHHHYHHHHHPQHQIRVGRSPVSQNDGDDEDNDNQLLETTAISPGSPTDCGKLITGIGLVHEGEIVVFDDIDTNWRKSAVTATAQYNTSYTNHHENDLYHHHHNSQEEHKQHQQYQKQHKFYHNQNMSSDDVLKVTKMIGQLPIAEYEGSPRRIGNHQQQQHQYHELSSPTATPETAQNTNNTNNLNMKNNSSNIRTSTSPLFPPRPGFPQRISPATNNSNNTSALDNNYQINNKDTISITTAGITNKQNNLIDICSNGSNGSGDINMFNSNNDDDGGINTKPKTPTFDYLYEFSETRKVLEEFFKGPNDEDKKFSDLNESDDLGSCDTHQECKYKDENKMEHSYIGQRLARIPNEEFLIHKSPRKQQICDDCDHNDIELYIDSNSRSSGELGDTELGGVCGGSNIMRRHSRNFTLSPETTDYDSNCGDLDSLSNDINCQTDFGRLYTSMPVLEDGLSSGHASDNENNFSSVIMDKKYLLEMTSVENNMMIENKNCITFDTTVETVENTQPTEITNANNIDGIMMNNVSNNCKSLKDNNIDSIYSMNISQCTPPPPAPAPHRLPPLPPSPSSNGNDLISPGGTVVATTAGILAETQDIQEALKDIRSALQRTKAIPPEKSKPLCDEIIQSPVWIPRRNLSTDSINNSVIEQNEKQQIKLEGGEIEVEVEEEEEEDEEEEGEPQEQQPEQYQEQQQCHDDDEADTDLETDRLLGQQRLDDQGFYDDKNWSKNPKIKSPLNTSSASALLSNMSGGSGSGGSGGDGGSSVASTTPVTNNTSVSAATTVKPQTFSSATIRQGIGTSLTSTSPEHCQIIGNVDISLTSPDNLQYTKSPTGSVKSKKDTSSNVDSNNGDKKSVTRNKEALLDPAVLIEGVLFRAKYLGSTQLVCEGQPTKSTRMMQAEEAVSRIKAPEGESQPSTEVDLFISTEKIMVLNTDLKEIMMDHALRTISYIADIGDLVVLMARRRFVPSDNEEGVKPNRTPKMICHVFESDEAQFIAQSIGQAFQVAYMEFLKANGIEDHSFVKEMDYQEVLNSQEIFGDELEIFAKKELQKEVVVPKAKGEILGVVIVESGWGSMLPTVVIANLMSSGAAARCGQLNIGDQLIAINGMSLVGLPLSTCQSYIRNTKNQTAVKFTVVPCPPVVEVKIKRPNTKYQLGFSVQNGVICSLLRGGIAERGGVRVGHRIIEINNQSVVAVPHEKIVNLLATSVGEILMKTMPTSMFRLLTGQENPVYI